MQIVGTEVGNCRGLDFNNHYVVSLNKVEDIVNLSDDQFEQIMDSCEDSDLINMAVFLMIYSNENNIEVNEVINRLKNGESILILPEESEVIVNVVDDSK